MSGASKRQAIRNVIAAALATASATSLIDAALAQNHPVTVKTQDGRELRITSHSSTAEVVTKGRVVNRAPSGTFTLQNGKTVVLEKGRLVGGTAADVRSMWMAFALMPAELEQRPQRTQ